MKNSEISVTAHFGELQITETFQAIMIHQQHTKTSITDRVTLPSKKNENKCYLNCKVHVFKKIFLDKILCRVAVGNVATQKNEPKMTFSEMRSGEHIVHLLPR
jgi:hypothetical protein